LLLFGATVFFLKKLHPKNMTKSQTSGFHHHFFSARNLL
jgi:hypothetical protein